MLGLLKVLIVSALLALFVNPASAVVFDVIVLLMFLGALI